MTGPSRRPGRRDVVHPVAATSSDPEVTGADAARWVMLSAERTVVTTEVLPIERRRLEVKSMLERRELTAARAPGRRRPRVDHTAPGRVRRSTGWGGRPPSP